MFSPRHVTAQWLMSGLQTLHQRGGAPTGLEFSGLTLDVGADVIQQLGARFRDPHFGVPMGEAVREALADTSAYRLTTDFAFGVLLDLIRLLDYFGSPDATRLLLDKLERGQFEAAPFALLERVAGVGARQEAGLSSRFDAALRQTLEWTPTLWLPFLRGAIDLHPEQALDVAVDHIEDIVKLAEQGDNALAMILGAFCFLRDPNPILRALARADVRRHKAVLGVLFDENLSPYAGIRLVPNSQPMWHFSRFYSHIDLTLDLYNEQIEYDALAALRRPPLASDSLVDDDGAHFDDMSAFEQLLRSLNPHAKEEVAL